jgi:hypothetical protein
MPFSWPWWPSEGFPTATCPRDALDAALGLDESYTKARARFRELHERLRGHRDFFEFEAATNEMVTTAVDVGFRVGTLDGEATVPVKPERRVPRVLDAWLVDVEARFDLTDSTKTMYDRVTRHLREWARLRAVQHLDLHGYVQQRLEAKVALRTLALELRVIRIFYRWARENRFIPHTANLRCPRIKIDRSRYVEIHATPTPSEAAKVIDVMPDDDWKVATILLARTGARVGEVVRLRSCDYDEVHGRLLFGGCGRCEQDRREVVPAGHRHEEVARRPERPRRGCSAAPGGLRKPWNGSGGERTRTGPGASCASVGSGGLSGRRCGASLPNSDRPTG